MNYYYAHKVLQKIENCGQNPDSLLSFSDRYFEDYLKIRHEDSHTPFLVRTVGIRHCFPDYHFLSRLSDRISLHLILSGKGYSDGQLLQYGDVLLLDSEHFHNFSSDKSDPCIFAWITFKGDECKNLLSKLGFFSPTSIAHIENLSEVCSIFYDMLYKKHPENSLEIFLDSSLYRILTFLMPQKAIETNQNNVRNQYINNSLSFIYKNLNNIDLTVSDIAKEIGLNEAYFRNIFSKEMGMSPKHYLLQFRIDSAKSLLLSSNYKVGEISDMVGFRDYRQFYDIFCNYEKISPKEYKKRMIESFGSNTVN